MESPLALVEAARAALATAYALPLDLITVSPGEVAWDFPRDCSEPPLVYVQIRSVSPNPQGATRLATGEVCVVLWDVVAAIGVMRCVATLDDTLQAPPPSEITSDALTILGDERTLLEIVASLGSTGAWTPLGPEGTMAGGEVVFTVPVDDF